MRLFVAVHLNIPVLNKIEKFISPFRQRYKEVKWVGVENLHITLKFLGETDEKLLDNIIKYLEKIQVSPFVLSVNNVGGFPHLKYPKILWIGLSGDLEKIKDLFEQIENEMSQLNFPKENREFIPHLTIGRVKGKMSKWLLNELTENQALNFGETKINSFSLMESKLTPKGAQYTEIKRFNLY